VLEKFLVWESSNQNFKLNILILEHAGVGITDPTASLNFSLSSQGMQTMILRAESGSEFIEASEDSNFFIRSLFF
jgi:hypothetical protein